MKTRLMALAGLLILGAFLAIPTATRVSAASNWTVNAALLDDLTTCNASVRLCKTIQGAINGATADDTINVLPGSYFENVTVSKSLTLAGAGQGASIIYPATSSPNPCGEFGGSLCTGASTIILVQASNVTIYGFTIDGDNPNLTSGVSVGGADIDARNGIITDYNLGVTLSNLVIYNVTVKNTWSRGIQASTTNGTFNIHDNTVQNVQGSTNTSVALFNSTGGGIFANNTVSDTPDALNANHSHGTQFLNNTVTNAGSGVHTDNAGDGGGTADLIQGNTISNCNTAQGGYGIWVFVPYIAPTFQSNKITNCAYGISAFGSGAAVTTNFNNNLVDGQHLANSVGVYMTSDQLGWGCGNVSTSFTGNAIVNNATGAQTLKTSTCSATATFHQNNISGNSTGLDNTGGATVDASKNWWGSPVGPGTSGNNGVDGAVTTSPFATALASSSTASTHELGENATLTTYLTVNGLYGVQFVVNHTSAILSFQSGAKNDAGTAPNDWNWTGAQIVRDFAQNTPSAGQTELAASLRRDTHPDVANLSNGNIATWTYQCAGVGTSPLTYDPTDNTGTLIADKNGFSIITAFTGDSVTCVPVTASAAGVIALQGRAQGRASPAGWNSAIVSLVCTSGACLGDGPYAFPATDINGNYQVIKAGPGSGVPTGTYLATVTRRGYLSAVKSVTIASGSNTLSTPTLLGGDVTGDDSININDLSAIGGDFGNTVTADTGADINGDGVVNILDLVLAGGNYGLSGAQSWP